MKAEVKSLADRGERLRIRPFIRDKVEQRLRMNAPFMSRWVEGLALAAQPLNLPATLQLEADLMDCMWHHAGDRAVDHNWYTKRLSLAAIYKATEMAMIEDRSEDFEQTWAFLDRRFEDELQFAKSMASLYDLQNVAAGVATTIHNMIGLPRR
jgi:ubiquinone biosynthesis protein COQ9